VKTAAAAAVFTPFSGSFAFVVDCTTARSRSSSSLTIW
jgi:hypothetical protein